MLQRCLSAYGTAVGRQPIFVTAFGLIITCSLCLGWLETLRRDPVQKADEIDEMWSVRGGAIAQEIKWVKDLRNDEPWSGDMLLTFFLGKGSWLGKDLLNPQALNKILPMYSTLNNLEVTTPSGKKYGFRDLCSRSPSMPDLPSNPQACAAWEASNRTDFTMGVGCNPPILPCTIASVLECFRELVDHHHPSYQYIDPAVAAVYTSPALVATSYASKPSFGTLTAEQVKMEVSRLRAATGTRGCPAWMGSLVYQPSVIGGDIEWNADKTLIQSMKAQSWAIILEAPRRAKFRLSMSKPDLANEAEIKVALDLMSEAWKRAVEDFSNNNEFLEAVVLTPNAAEEANEANTKTPTRLIFLGLILMLVFMTLTLGDWRHPLMSRVFIAHLGLFPILISIAASGGVVLLAGMKLNTAIIMTLPFLGLGLGVDDLFVLTRYFSRLGVKYITEHDTPEIMGQVFSQAGTGVTLTSICNATAFAASALLPVPAIMDFSICAAVVSVMNYFSMMTVVPGLLALEVRRIKRKQAEPSCLTVGCHMQVIKRWTQSGEEPVELVAEDTVVNCETRLVQLLKTKAAPALASPVGIVASLLITAALVGVSIWAIIEQGVGYKPKDLVTRGSSMHRPLEILFERYTSFPSILCFVDVDVPRHQADMLRLFDQITSLPNAARHNNPAYLTLFAGYLAGALQANPALAQTGWSLNPSVYSHPVLAPAGIATSDPQSFYTQFAQWSYMPLDNPAQAYEPGGSAFTSADLGAVNEFAKVSNNYRDAPLKFSFFKFYVTNLETDQNYIDTIKEIRRLVDESPLRGKAFPSGTIFTYWSVFLELRTEMWKALAIDLGLVFLCTLVLLRSPVAALVSSFACAFIVMEVYGICMLFLQYNMFIAAALLASAGIAVEFTAHLVAAFYLEDSHLPVVERLGESLAKTSPAVIQGSVSTFLGILPLAFSPVPFIGKYMFAPFAITAGLGLLNGLVVLPSLLAVFRCRSGSRARAPAVAVGTPAQGNNNQGMVEEGFKETKKEDSLKEAVQNGTPVKEESPVADIPAPKQDILSDSKPLKLSL